MKKMTKISIITLLTVLFISIFSVVVFAEGASGDPTGVKAATVNQITAQIAGKPTSSEITTQIAKNTLGVNYVWVLMTGMLIFFFQCGFAMVETGFCRSKNALHTMAMNFMVFIVGAIGYFLVGFAIQFGGVGGWTSLGSGVATLNHEVSIAGWGIFGTKGLALASGGTYDVGVYALFFFQMVFMDTTCTIPTGSMAERVKYSVVVINSFFVSMIFYPLFGNWVWGGGWLSQMGVKLGLGHGAVDFAGSAVVHSMGGMMALAGAIVIGPRIGKFRKDGTAVAFPGHDIPMAIIGTIILFFCWFAFNAGSTTNATDLRLAVVATNTMIAGAVGGFTAMMYMWLRYGKPDPSMMCNGALAGLVAITAPCAFVNGISSFIIGIISGILVCISVRVFEDKFKIDDPVGAISVHCVNGVFGVLAVGLFADGTYGDGLNGIKGGVIGLFYGGGFKQLEAQLICVAVLIVWGFGLSYLFYKVLDKTMGLRVSAQVEIDGLDVPEMGMLAYPDFALNPDNIEISSSIKERLIDPKK